MTNNIMFLGDTHSNTFFTLKAIRTAVEYECKAIMQLGDFGIWDHTQMGVQFLDIVDDALEDAGIELIFCDGNHENFDSLLRLSVSDDGFRRVKKNILHAPRGHIWETEGVTFMAMGGAHSIDGPGGVWPQCRGPVFARGIMEDDFDMGGWWPQETIKVGEAYDAKEIALLHRDNVGEIDVLIAHDCPAGVPIPGINGYPAGNQNRRLLADVCDAADPKYIFCGHYHQRYTDSYRNAKLEILAADINDAEQALVISPEKLKEWYTNE